MEPYRIKHQHQETANHSEYSFAYCYWLHTRYKHTTPTRRNLSFFNGHSSQLHATQLKQLTQKQKHPLHDFNTYSDPPRNIKITIFHNNEKINIVISEPNITIEECRKNLKYIHTTISLQYFGSKKNNKVTNTTPYDIHSSKQKLPHHMRNVTFNTKLYSSEPTNHNSCKLPSYSEP